MARRTGAAVREPEDRRAHEDTATQRASVSGLPGGEPPDSGRVKAAERRRRNTAPLGAAEVVFDDDPGRRGRRTGPPRSAPSGVWDVGGAVEAAQARWEVSAEFTQQTLARVGETVHRFARRLTVQGVCDVREITVEHCRGFVFAHTAGGQAPELTTQHARRTALRMLFTVRRGANETARGMDEPFSGGKLQESRPKWVMAMIWCFARSAGSEMRGCAER